MQTYLKQLRHGLFNLIRGDMISEISNYCGEWSEAEVAIFASFLPQDGVVIEVGSNIGLHAVPIAQMIHQGKLICFEPQRIIYQQLLCNLALNNIIHAETHRLAVGNENKRLTIQSTDYETSWNYGAFSLNKGFHSEALFTGKINEDQVEMIQLDDFLFSSLKRLDLIKIDAEGLERTVLMGAEKIIQNFRPVLFVEFHPEDLNETLNLLHSWDYEVYWVISPRYQNNNFFGAEYQQLGHDGNFLALPKNYPIHSHKLKQLLSILTPAHSAEQLQTGEINILNLINE